MSQDPNQGTAPDEGAEQPKGEADQAVPAAPLYPEQPVAGGVTAETPEEPAEPDEPSGTLEQPAVHEATPAAATESSSAVGGSAHAGTWAAPEHGTANDQMPTYGLEGQAGQPSDDPPQPPATGPQLAAGQVPGHPLGQPASSEVSLAQDHMQQAHEPLAPQQAGEPGAAQQEQTPGQQGHDQPHTQQGYAQPHTQQGYAQPAPYGQTPGQPAVQQPHSQPPQQSQPQQAIWPQPAQPHAQTPQGPYQPQPSGWGQQPQQTPPAFGASSGAPSPSGFGSAPSQYAAPPQGYGQQPSGQQGYGQQAPAQQAPGQQSAWQQAPGGPHGAAPQGAGFGAPGGFNQTGQPNPQPSAFGAPGPAQQQGQGNDTVKVVIAVLVGVVLLVLIVFGAWKLFSGGGGGNSSGEEEISCSSDVCSQVEAIVGSEHIGGDDVVWTLRETWADFDSGDSRQLGGGTAAYTSEVGEVVLTAVSFESGAHAADYANTVMADLGEPIFTGPVWDGHYEGRGEGVLNQFDVDGTETLVWYDDGGFVCTLVGPLIDLHDDPVFNFYFTLPEI